jgi:transposase
MRQQLKAGAIKLQARPEDLVQRGRNKPMFDFAASRLRVKPDPVESYAKMALIRPGCTRFKWEGWYKSFTYPQAGFKLEGSKLPLSKIGSIRIFEHREVEVRVKTCTIKKDKIGGWYAILVTEVEDIPQIELQKAVGVDVGLKSLVALSTDETIQNHRDEFPASSTQEARRFSRSNCI